jgi:sugar (pentulose or hexulose) kinase
MKEEVIAIFDIGKTNKKILLLDTSLRIVSETEEKFASVQDEDGFECDNIDQIEKWIRESVSGLISSDDYELKGVNFSTYGASLVYLDGQGRRLSPVYNYLKPVDESLSTELYSAYGGKEEFCRKTASPALGMLNSGIQTLWFKKNRPDLFSRVRTVLHLPQYLSYTLSGELCSEHTSIGCHTAIWDFDNMKYHQWVKDEAIPFPDPVPVTTIFKCNMKGRSFFTGTGLHDSSSSLVPYFAAKAGNFILMSTGTWCISMNPFNNEILSGDQLSRDCLCYMSINREPVKSSRVFLGHMHDTSIQIMSNYFKIHENSFRLVKPDSRIMNKLMDKPREEKIFIEQHGNEVHLKVKEEPDLFVFDNFIEAYHLLMVELSDLAVESVNLIIPENDLIENIYITGGFSKNLLFLKLIASSFPEKKVWTSEIGNATALGAASVMLSAIYPENAIIPDLGLNEVKI